MNRRSLKIKRLMNSRGNWEITLSSTKITKILDKNLFNLSLLILIFFSIISFYYYYQQETIVIYNDARSHLNISRRVVEGIKPGFAQIGSVWLPLPHLLMVLTVWNDFFWHSGLSGAIISMLSFVGTGILIFKFLEKLHVGKFAMLFSILVWCMNLNVLYLQSTAMTELLLLFLMTAGAYYFYFWSKDKDMINIIKSATFIMLSTLVRYDGWFLFATIFFILGIIVFRKRNIKETEGVLVMFSTLAGFGIFLWLLWNLVIFKDPLYFAFGPFSAHSQQSQIEAAGELVTKGKLFLSIKYYVYAVFYNTYTFVTIIGLLGFILLLLSKKIKVDVKLSLMALASPFVFNVLALYLGHSVLFVPPLSGSSLFNVRYGIMLMPAVAVFSAYFVSQIKELRWLVTGTFLLVAFFGFINFDAVTIEDALLGASGKNVQEVSGWLRENVSDKEGFVLVSAASHDAILFSSGLPMKRFIHEGTDEYWKSAIKSPDRWARWIVMRTHDVNDMTYSGVKDSYGFNCCFEKVDSYPFADIYELKPEYVDQLNYESELSFNAY